MRLRGEANVGGVPPEPTGGSGTCRTGPEHVAPITGYGAKAPVGFPCWMSRSTPACHIGKERPIRGACRRASPVAHSQERGLALDYPTAHPHAPRSLVRRDRAEASRTARAGPMESVHLPTGSSSGLSRGSWFSTRRNQRCIPTMPPTGILGTSPRMTAVVASLIANRPAGASGTASLLSIEMQKAKTASARQPGK
jgi:hypothetical protein